MGSDEMKNIKCLWLEHDKKLYSRYSEPIATRFEKLFEIPLKITHVTTISEALMLSLGGVRNEHFGF